MGFSDVRDDHISRFGREGGAILTQKFPYAFDDH
jgi:hypothetical protein